MGRCRPGDVLEVVRNHQFAIARRRNAWEIIEDASLKVARSELEQLNASLEQRVAERTAQLQRLFSEKDELFREVHHRVRNNLQVIASLVRMKLRQANAQEIRQTYADILGRVDAIALVHDTLYAADEASKVPIAEYLERLCTGLVELSGNREKVTVRVAATDADIALDQAVPLGLITTELVTNALKHAFPDGRTGQVEVSFGREDGLWVLSVADNGVGIGSLEQKGRSRSGLRLLSSLALQLGATVAESFENGTRFELRFSSP